MKVTKFVKAAAALAISFALAACGAHSLSLETLDEAAGVKAIAENAGEDNVATSESAITVADGDVIVISPCLDKGSFNLTITEHDSGAVLYDENVKGRVLFQIDAEPGTYDVSVSGKGATGWMTVFAESADEIAEQDALLEDTLEDAGVNPGTLTDGE